MLARFPRSSPSKQMLHRYLAQTAKDIAQAHRMRRLVDNNTLQN
ncbi:MAG: hypothetical protein ACK2U1_07025 [Anaerolineales bacterium]